MSWLVTFLIEASNAKFNRAVKPATASGTVRKFVDYSFGAVAAKHG